MNGDPLIDRLMRPVIDAMVRNGIRGTVRTDIYNRAYEAVMNSMVVMDTMREQLSKATARAEAAERELAELKELANAATELVGYIKTADYAKAHLQMMVLEVIIEEREKCDENILPEL